VCVVFLDFEEKAPLRAPKRLRFRPAWVGEWISKRYGLEDRRGDGGRRFSAGCLEMSEKIG
jgi:hypothetical protein